MLQFYQRKDVIGRLVGDHRIVGEPVQRGRGWAEHEVGVLDEKVIELRGATVMRR